MKRRTIDSAKLRRALKRNRVTDTAYGNSLIYLKLLLIWSFVMMIDFMLDLRVEYLWPFWLMLRSIYDSFRYQGMTFSVFFICITLTSDVICFIFIPMQWIFFIASTYVWVQYVWQADRGICLPTTALWLLFIYFEAAMRLKELKPTSFTLDLCRPFAAHCIGYPVVTLGFGVKSYVCYRLRLRRQGEVKRENRTLLQLLRSAVPVTEGNGIMEKAKGSHRGQSDATSGVPTTATCNGIVQNGTAVVRYGNSTSRPLATSSATNNTGSGLQQLVSKMAKSKKNQNVNHNSNINHSSNSHNSAKGRGRKAAGSGLPSCQNPVAACHISTTNARNSGAMNRKNASDIQAATAAVSSLNGNAAAKKVHIGILGRVVGFAKSCCRWPTENALAIGHYISEQLKTLVKRWIMTKAQRLVSDKDSGGGKPVPEGASTVASVNGNEATAKPAEEHRSELTTVGGNQQQPQQQHQQHHHHHRRNRKRSSATAALANSQSPSSKMSSTGGAANSEREQSVNSTVGTDGGHLVITEPEVRLAQYSVIDRSDDRALIHEDVSQLKCDLLASKDAEYELRLQMYQGRIVENCLRVDLSNSKAKCEALSRRLQEVLRARETDRNYLENVEKLLSDSQTAREKFERMFNRERRNLKRAEESVRQVTTTRADCESCKRKRDAEKELKQARKELADRDKRLKHLDEQLKLAQENREVVQERESFGKIVAGLESKIVHLEESLSSETRIKLDLFSALGEARRHQEDMKKSLKAKDQEIGYLRHRVEELTKVVGPSSPVNSTQASCSAAGTAYTAHSPLPCESPILFVTQRQRHMPTPVMNVDYSYTMNYPCNNVPGPFVFDNGSYQRAGVMHNGISGSPIDGSMGMADRSTVYSPAVAQRRSQHN